MKSGHFFKKAVKSPLNWLLQISAIRSRVIFELKQHHFADLDFNVPLTNGIECPISSFEHWCSFSEIFLGGEYDEAWQEIPLPARWLDLGCHAGYFSLYVAWLRVRKSLTTDYSALLVDADSRSGSAVEKMISLNQLSGRLAFEHGAISRKTGTLRFNEREFMASAAVELGGEDGKEIIVPILTQEKIMQLLPGPYDLVKIDVEGSEFDFLEAYGDILSGTTYLIIEWHAWHSGGGGEKQIRESVSQAGFDILHDMIPGRSIHGESDSPTCGVLFCGRKSLK